MSKRKTDFYEAYLRSRINSSQKLTNAFSKQYMQQPQQMQDNAVLTVEDKPIVIDENANANKQNVPVDAQLFALLTPYIQDVNNINKIINDPKLTEILKEYLVYNWDTDVVPKLNAFKNKRVDIITITSLLIRIATQLFNIDTQAEVNKTQQEINYNFIDKGKAFFEKSNYSTSDKVTYCNIVIKSKIELNKEKMTEPKIVAIINDAEGTKPTKPQNILAILSLFEIDRVYDNLLYNMHNINGSLVNIKQHGFVLSADLGSDYNKLKTNLSNPKYFTASQLSKLFDSYKKEIISYTYINSLPIKDRFSMCKEIYDNESGELQKFITPLLPSGAVASAPATSSTSGASALSGTGFETGMSKNHEHHLNGKFMLNKHKLARNILEIRYTKNRHLIPIKAQYISNALKSMITKRLDGDYTVDKKMFNQLGDTEKHLYRSLTKYLDIDSGDLPDDDEQMDSRAQIVFGELSAGNNNPDIKKEAYKYLIHAYHMKKISYADFMSLIKNYNL